MNNNPSQRLGEDEEEEERARQRNGFLEGS